MFGMGKSKEEKQAEKEKKKELREFNKEYQKRAIKTAAKYKTLMEGSKLVAKENLPFSAAALETLAFGFMDKGFAKDWVKTYKQVVKDNSSLLSRAGSREQWGSHEQAQKYEDKFDDSFPVYLYADLMDIFDRYAGQVDFSSTMAIKKTLPDEWFVDVVVYLKDKDYFEDLRLFGE
mgnify:FL=1